VPAAESQLADFSELMRARALVQADQLDTAQAIYERILAEHPRHIRALLEAARFNGIRFQCEAAEALLERARVIAAGDRRVLIAIAQCYRTIHRPEKGIAAFEELDRTGGLTPPLLAELAELHEICGRLAQAREAIERSAAAAGNRPEPQLILARIERQQGDFAAAENRADAVAKRSDSPPLLRIQAWAELCCLYDTAGDHDNAVAAIEQAKQLTRSLPETQGFVQQAARNNVMLARLYESLDQDTIVRWQSAAPPLNQRVGGVAHLTGFPRSGTTLLEQVLGAHAGIVDSPERAIFTREIVPAMHGRAEGGRLTFAALDGLSHQRHELLQARYLDMMQSVLGEPLGGRLHLDKNPNHTSLLAALIRLFPTSKFLVALRDPRDVVVSCYLRYFHLTEFSSGFLSWKSACELYAFEMEIWLRFRELLAGQSLEVRYEDSVNDLPAVAQRAIEFLGLPFHAEVLRYRDQIANKQINSPSHIQVRQPLHRSAIGRWRNYERYLAPHMAILRPYLDAFGYR